MCAVVSRLCFAEGGIRGLRGGGNCNEVLHRHLDAAATLTAGESRAISSFCFPLFPLVSRLTSLLVPAFLLPGMFVFCQCLFSFFSLLPRFFLFFCSFPFSFFFVFFPFVLYFFFALLMPLPLLPGTAFPDASSFQRGVAPASVCVTVGCEMYSKVSFGVLRVCR